MMYLSYHQIHNIYIQLAKYCKTEKIRMSKISKNYSKIFLLMLS